MKSIPLQQYLHASMFSDHVEAVEDLRLLNLLNEIYILSDSERWYMVLPYNKLLCKLAIVAVRRNYNWNYLISHFNLNDPNKFFWVTGKDKINEGWPAGRNGMKFFRLAFSSFFLKINIEFISRFNLKKRVFSLSLPLPEIRMMKKKFYFFFSCWLQHFSIWIHKNTFTRRWFHVIRIN